MQKKEPLEKSGRAEPWGQEEPVSRSASWRHDFARLFFFSHGLFTATLDGESERGATRSLTKTYTFNVTKGLS